MTFLSLGVGLVTVVLVLAGDDVAGGILLAMDDALIVVGDIIKVGAGVAVLTLLAAGGGTLAEYKSLSLSSSLLMT